MNEEAKITVIQPDLANAGTFPFIYINFKFWIPVIVRK